MSDSYDLKPHIRSVKDYPIAGVEFRDITSLLETPTAFKTACNAMTSICRDFRPTTVVAIESRGFIFAGPMAHELGLPFVLARKPGKLPNPAFSRSFDLEYGSTSLEVQKNTRIGSQDRVVIVDDLIATGGTAMGCADLLNEDFGVPKENILVAALIDLPALKGSAAIDAAGYEARSIVAYD
mgnify:FL=1